MFCYPLTDHLMPADASAPLNKRTAPSSNSFSLRYLFRKNEILLSPMFCFLPIPQFFSTRDLRITVALLLLLFSFFLVVVHLLKYFIL